MPEYRVRFYCVLGILAFGGVALLMAPGVYAGLFEGQFTANVGTRQNPREALLVFNDDPLTFVFYFIKDSWAFLLMAGAAAGCFWRLVRGPKGLAFGSKRT